MKIMSLALIVLALDTVTTCPAKAQESREDPCDERVLTVCGKRPGFWNGTPELAREWRECRERVLSQCYAEFAQKAIHLMPQKVEAKIETNAEAAPATPEFQTKADATAAAAELENRLKQREEEIQELRRKVDELAAKVDLILLTLEALGKKQ